MTQSGFEEYIYAVYSHKSGAAGSYITAIRIIDKLLAINHCFGLNGKSITCIEDPDLLKQIADFVCNQQLLYKRGEDSIFRNISAGQTSYARNGFCSAAIRQLVNYQEYDNSELVAWTIVSRSTKGSDLSKDLVNHFKLDKEGKDVETSTKVRLGQSYFRKMVLQNYQNKCCVCGLNIPQTLRASHIVAWAESPVNRLNPENGLCLSATYDAAFDKHLISFDDDYRMIVSKEIRDYYTNEAVIDYFKNYEGKIISLPQLFLPSKKLLEKHRNFLVG